MQRLAKHIEANGGEEWVFNFVAEGLSMKKVAERIGASSRGMLYLWIDMDRDRRRRLLQEARERSADAHAEDGLEILDGLEAEMAVTSAEVQRANSRANYRKWLAGVRNREAYGEPKAGVDVNVNIGSLHLDALRAHANSEALDESGLTAVPPSTPEAEPVEADYTIEEDTVDDEDVNELAELLS